MYHSHSISKQELDKIIHLNPLAKSKKMSSPKWPKKTHSTRFCVWWVIQIPNKNIQKPEIVSRSDEVSDKCPTKSCLRNGCSRWTGCRLPAVLANSLALNNLTMEGVKNDGTNHLSINDSNPLSEASNYLFQRKNRHQPWLQRGCNSSFSPQVRKGFPQ